MGGWLLDWGPEIAFLTTMPKWFPKTVAVMAFIMISQFIMDLGSSQKCISSRVVSHLYSQKDQWPQNLETSKKPSSMGVDFEEVSICQKVGLRVSKKLDPKLWMRVFEETEKANELSRTFGFQNYPVKVKILNGTKHIRAGTDEIWITEDLIDQPVFLRALILAQVRNNIWSFQDEPILQESITEALLEIYFGEVDLRSASLKVPYSSNKEMCQDKNVPITYLATCLKADSLLPPRQNTYFERPTPWTIKPLLVRLIESAYLKRPLLTRFEDLKRWVAALRGMEKISPFSRNIERTSDLRNLMTYSIYQLSHLEFGQELISQLLIWYQKPDLKPDHNNAPSSDDIAAVL